MKVRRAYLGQLERSTVEELCGLWLQVWPPEVARTPEVQAENLLKGLETSPFEEGKGAMLHYCVDADGRLVAAARSFLKRIRFQGSRREANILALASVCSDPKRRGEGWGRAVVLDAFERLREEPERFECCLFQTRVPDFYRRFGAGEVGNQFVNSLNTEAPEANPWWNASIMIYPAEAPWETGQVDLLGPGY